MRGIPDAASGAIGGAVPSTRAPSDDAAMLLGLEQVGDEERWLWRLIEEAERIAAQAPAAPDPRQLAAAELRYQRAYDTEQRLQARISAIEEALRRPGTWLRPSHRAALARDLRDNRAAAMAAAVHRGRIAELRHRLRAQAVSRAAYFTQHRLALNAGENARAAVSRLLDELIDGYARLHQPPAWFRYGLGYPPPPGPQAEWLVQARAAIASRRRLALAQPPL